jgi:hypothetical protein
VPASQDQKIPLDVAGRSPYGSLVSRRFGRISPFFRKVRLRNAHLPDKVYAVYLVGSRPHP